MPSASMTPGAPFEMTWTFKTSPTAPLDITGYSVLVQIRPSPCSDRVIDSFDNASPELTISAAGGEVAIVIPPSQTIAYNFSTAAIDCWIYSDDDTSGARSATYIINRDCGVSRE